MKKIIAITLVLVLLYSMCGSGFGLAQETVVDRISNQERALEQYQLLLQNLSMEKSARNVSPDYYGGAYINSDGNLVVCVTNAYDTSSNAIQTYTQNSDILIRTVDYTFEELLQEQNRVTALYEAMTDAVENSDTAASVDAATMLLVKSFRGTYIDEERNILVVQIEDLSDEMINVFTKLFSDKAYIVFEEGYTNVATAADWQPGRQIYITSENYLSTGYPVYFTNEDGERERGFITAGHGYDVGDYVYTNYGANNVLGVCVASQNSGNTDAALIQVTSGVFDICSTTYYNGVTLSTMGYVVPAQGTTIYKEGVASQLTSGTVTSTSVNVHYIQGPIITDLIATTAFALPGDSGGVVYASPRHVVGSVSGAAYNGTTQNESTFVGSYMCKYLNAAAALDCTIWE